MPTDGLGESAGAASTEAREIVDSGLCDDLIVAQRDALEVLIDRALRERERAALERAAKVAEGCWHGPRDYGCGHGFEIAKSIRALLGGE